MAPQNSTLLHENAELVADKIIRYSPILTLPNGNDCDSANSTDEHNGVVRRKKSIHNFSMVDTQADDEVPIWICGEPRFISGVTSTTTCNEIIQALIDDELNNVGNDVAASRDLNDYVITEKWRDVEQALPGETNILPIWVAWGNARNEVKFKLKINKNKAGTKTLADGFDVDDDVQKQNKQLKNRKIIALAQMLRRLIHQGENIKEQLATISDKPKSLKGSRTRHAKDILMQSFLAMTREVSQPALLPAISPPRTPPMKKRVPQLDEQIVASPDDELFLLIDNDNCSDSGVHVEYRQYYLNRKLNLAIEAAKNGKLTNYESTPKRTSSRRKLHFDALRQNSLNDRLIKYLCHNEESMWPHQLGAGTADDGFCGIRREIDIRIGEMHELIAYEEMLTQQLTEQCEKYHRLNNKYMSKMHFELCIDEVQRCLDVCAKEIIRCELELQRVKDEIHQKCGILYNLQRMVNAEPKNEIKNSSDSFAREQIRFSESINNKSMII